MDFDGRKSEFFYALGGEDVEALPKTKEDEKLDE